jgi:NAD(P)-dependent dehydrogenase (short-subunit alcohol dehydrogenase family)
MVVKTVQSYGRLDILVNNAGIVVEGSLIDTMPSNWHLVMNVNLASIYRCSRAAIPQMLRGGDSSIINISSTQGLAGFTGSAAYATSKGGIIALTRQMARDYSRSGIRVNCICPGVVLTPIFAKSDYRDSFFDMCDEFHPIGHCGLPEDIAYASLFLACNESSYVTGAILPVDGGISSSGSY